MAKKQVVLNPTSVSGAAPARAAKPSSSRTRTSKHSKAVVSGEKPEDIATTANGFEQEVEQVASQPAEDPNHAISHLAYGYWEARGFQGGDPIDDWVRAEEEYRRRLTV